ncbi:MAG: tetratricopeptide repeat protein [Planctomycetaceae bacterium]
MKRSFWILSYLAAAALVMWGCQDANDLPDPADQTKPPPQVIPDLPALSSSPFLNTDPRTQYVGMNVCKECHEAEFYSYHQTAHSLALADVIPENEPPPGEFRHKASGRSYQISKHDGKCWHAESIVQPDGTKTLLQEHPMRYVMGSGRFSRSYLVELDGFLMESPATWYSASQKWALSPGYALFNQGFHRPTEIRCVACHAGRVESIENSPHRLAILEQAIGCERCHGPGSLHVAHWSNEPKESHNKADVTDLTIVNPRRLSRELAEDICAQCHLHGEAAVELRGRNPADYRPGLPLSDFLVHFGLKRPREEMSVVGHVEQMRLSACYRSSEEMTCTTCHDPHAKPSAKEQVSYYRTVCLNCHQSKGCRMAETKRIKATADDSCIFCHMPQTPTEIPHFAFTHHRIGIHKHSSAAPPDKQPAELIAYDDSRLTSEADKDRAFGLAYQQLLTDASHQAFAQEYSSRAFDHLLRAKDSGLNDAELEAGLSRLYWQTDPDEAMESARAALESPTASPDAISTALFTLGTTLVMQDRAAEAIPVLERLVAIRRHSGVWQALAQAYRKSGQPEKAIAAIRKSIEVDPARIEPVIIATEIAQETGDTALAKKFQQRLRSLQRAIPQKKR